MALAIRFDRLIREDVVSDQSELARLAHVTQPRMTQIMNLLHLAPDIQEELLFLPLVTGAVSFIKSPDFDTADEPIVGDVITVKPDGTTRRRSRRADPQIYHHKWLFVADDYKGFNVAASKRRSATWLKLADIDKSRIGTKSYWEEHVVPRIGS